MSVVTRFTTFEDAFYFYLQAKGMPLVSSSEAFVERYCRVRILLSWVALEEAVKSAAAILKQKGLVAGPFPAKLYDKLSHLLAGLHQPAIDKADFLKQRRVRNDLTHANQNSQGLIMTPDDALATFQFCFEAACAIWPHKIAHP